MLEKLKEKDKQLMQLRDNNKELTKLNKVNRNIKKIKRKNSWKEIDVLKGVTGYVRQCCGKLLSDLFEKYYTF